MKRNPHLILLSILLTIGINIQAGSIKGTITDDSSQSPVSFASIAIILDGQNDALVGSISDEQGEFHITQIPNGHYTAIISFIGYETKEVNNIIIKGGEKDINLGNITLTSKAIGLKTIEISGTSKTFVKKIDRQTYKANDFETAKGGTAIDALDKLPAVSVDADGQVSLRGASDFMVYINGKPSVIEASSILSQIPSDNIENIDIITVPTSKYDSQGKGGIINITTKRNTNQGFSLSATGMTGGTPWSNTTEIYNQQALDNTRYNDGLNIMYNTEKLSLYGGFNMQSRHNNGIGIINPYIYQQPGEVDNGMDGKYYVLEGVGSRPKWYSNVMFNVGANYAITDNSDLTASYQFSQRESGRTANYKYNAYFADTPTSAPIVDTEQEIYNPNDIHRDGWFSNLSLDYNIKLNQDSRLNTSLTYEASNLTQTIENKEYAYEGERYYYDDAPDFHSFQSDKTPLDAYRLAFDYETKLDNGSAINAGLQSQWVRLDGIFEYDTIVGNDFYGDASSYDNNMDLNRDVYAAYVDYSNSVGKFNYIIGLRMEYMNQTMNVDSTNYFNYVYDYFGDIGNGRSYEDTEFSQNKFDFFPTLHVGYTHDENNSFSLAASRRINRPPAKDLSPFLYRRHQEIYEMGDPLLEPEYILLTELNYTRNLGKHNFILTGFYRSVNNAIYRVNRVAYDMGNPGGVLLRSYTNAGTQKALGLEAGINLDLIDRVKVYLGGSLYDFRVIANDELLGDSRNSQSTNWNFKSNIAWTITKPLKLTLDYSIKSGTVTPQGENLSFQQLNAAINYKPTKLISWAFSAKMLDILGTNQAGGYTAAFENGQELLRRDYVYDYEGQIIELTASYTFNNKKHKKAKDLIGDEYF